MSWPLNFTSRKREKFAVYLNDARYAYQFWGAAAKVQALDARYPHLLTQRTARPTPIRDATIAVHHNTTTLASSSASWLDLSSVMKAAQTLSGEIVLGRLLEKMMHIVLENAGAENGSLLLSQDGDWLIEAEGHADRAEVTVLQSTSIETSGGTCRFARCGQRWRLYA